MVPKRIALIKPSALGDIVSSLPVLTSLRRRFPQAHITWIVNRAYEPLLRHHPDLDGTLAFDRHALRRGVFQATRSAVDFILELRRRRFDLVIDLQGLFRTGLMSLLTGARCRLGLASAREGARLFYTHVVSVPPGLHAVDRYLLAVKVLGGECAGTFHLNVAPDALQWTRALLDDWPRPWLAVGVGARWQTKRWPPQHFAELVRRAQANFGGTAIFIGGNDEAELGRQAMSLLDRHALDLSGKTTLPQLAAILALADVVLANDTGPLHLAVALGRPVVAPYTCTQARYHGPYGQPDHAVETAVACGGSYRRTCRDMVCMNELTPDRLWPILQGMLQSWQDSFSPADLEDVATCSNGLVLNSLSGHRTSMNPPAPA